MTDRARELAEPDFCEKCHAHIIPMGFAEYLWSRICFRLVMWWPVRFLPPQKARETAEREFRTYLRKWGQAHLEAKGQAS